MLLMNHINVENIFDKTLNTDFEMMRHFNDGIPFFLKLLKKYNNMKDIDDNYKRYINNYLRIYLEYKFPINYLEDSVFSLHLELIEANFLMDIKYLWLSSIYSNISSILELNSHKLVILDFINCSIFRKYCYKKEMEYKGKDLETKSVLGKIIGKLSGETDVKYKLDIYQLFYFMIMNKDYVGKSFVLELASKIYKENKLREHLRDSLISNNSNTFLFNFIEILYQIWFKLYQFNSNIDDILVQGFLYHYIKIIEISFNPILENLIYHKNKFNELNDISVRDSRTLIREKLMYKKKILKSESFLKSNYSNINNILNFYNWISKLMVLIDKNEVSRYDHIFCNCFNYIIRLKQLNIQYIVPNELINIYSFFITSPNLITKYNSFYLYFLMKDRMKVKIDEFEFLTNYTTLIHDLNDNEYKISFLDKNKLTNFSINILGSDIYKLDLQTINIYINDLISDTNRIFTIIKDRLKFYNKNKTLVKKETIISLNNRAKDVDNILYHILQILRSGDISLFENLYYSINRFYQFNLIIVNSLYEFDKEQVINNIDILPNIVENIGSIYLLFLRNDKFEKTITIDESKQIDKYLDNLSTDYPIIKDIHEIFNNFDFKKPVPYPEEFCDPLLYIPIENPVVLPNSNIIMDRNSIEKHLLNNKSNPFSMEPLTKQELDNFNVLDTTKKIIETFINKKIKWLQDYLDSN